MGQEGRPQRTRPKESGAQRAPRCLSALHPRPGLRTSLQGLGLVFVAVYQKALKLLYVDELLERLARAFASRYKPDCYQYPVGPCR